MAYSQRDEEQYIIPYFKGEAGTFLDIGAYHPFKFSNTRALYELGWSGAFVEPSKNLWKPFEEEYAKDLESGRLELHKVAIADKDAVLTFYDSGGDAVSSFDKQMVTRWGYNNPESYEVRAYAVPSFLELTSFEKFQFINIDTEGFGIEILEQIPFEELDVKMVCIEFDDKLTQISDFLSSKGFKKLHQTPENLIFVR